MVAGDPHQGGATWAVLQYLHGFRRLGHEVVLIEPVDELATAVVSYFEGLGLDGAALLRRGTRETVGLPYALLTRFARDADVLVNISGLLQEEALTERIPKRVYVDLDPAFNQLWHGREQLDVGFEGHTHHVTVGQALGQAGCDVPTWGFEWIPTVPPVVLERWQPGDGLVHDALTTVGNWRAYGSIQVDGVFYGQKAHSLRELVALPARTDERFVLAVDVHPDERGDLDALSSNGWELVDPAAVAGTPDAYRRFVRGSKAEFGLAKLGYVRSRCGWFSDRSACYLAGARPVLAQDTGFADYLPTGEGLLSFRDEDDALAGVERLRGDYPRHRAAARAIAEDLLDSDKVLNRLLAAVS